MNGVSIIVPVIRPEKALECKEALGKNIVDYNIETIFEDDIEGIGAPEMVKRLTEKARYNLVLFLGDDTIPEEGFIDEAVKVMNKFPGGWGVVGLNTEGHHFADLSKHKIPRGRNPLAHWLAHKKMLEYIPGGCFFSTEYKHCFGDNELYDIADSIDRWAFAEKATVKHIHPVNGTAEYDETYKEAYGDGKFEHDQKTYYKRKIARIREKQGERLGIAWPLTSSMVYANFIYAFLAMKKPDHDFFVPEYPGAIDAVRNNLVQQALNKGVTKLWMTDTDQIYFDDDTINKLMAHDAPVVTVPVMRRYPPFDPMLWRKNKKGENIEVSYGEIKKAIDEKKTLKINSTGAGCLLFDMDVFLEIEKPWFKLPRYGESGPGEDVYFWDKAYKAGYEILSDCSIEIQHLTTMGVGWNTHQLFKKFYGG